MIGILGIVVIIVAAVLAYRTAKQYERNAALWATIVIALGFGIQIVVPILIAIVLAVVMAVRGSDQLEVQSALETPLGIIGFVCLFLSVVAVILVLKHLSKVPEDEFFTAPPLPPTSFD